MTPDARPLRALTAEIAKTSEFWLFFGPNLHNSGWTSIHRADELDFGTVKPDGWLRTGDGQGYEVESEGTRCYPVTRNPETGMVHPAPWPMLEGEWELVEWRGVPYNVPFVAPHGFSDVWCMAYDRKSIPVSNPHFNKPYYPAPRQDNRWVWVEDKQP